MSLECKLQIWKVSEGKVFELLFKKGWADTTFTRVYISSREAQIFCQEIVSVLRGHSLSISFWSCRMRLSKRKLPNVERYPLREYLSSSLHIHCVAETAVCDWSGASQSFALVSDYQSSFDMRGSGSLSIMKVFRAFYIRHRRIADVFLTKTPMLLTYESFFMALYLEQFLE